jgi:P27 family predicted phage terminase small subunit
MAGVPGRSGGRNKKSIQEHRLRGTYKPSRHDDRVATASAIPLPSSLQAPAHLTGDAKAFWQELAPLLERAGLLTALDLPRLELLCVHLGHHRELYVRLNELLAKAATNNTPTDTSRISRSLRQEADTIRGLSVGFGLDPADRVRMHVRPIDPNNPWAEVSAPNPLQKFLTRPNSKWAGMLP